MIRRFVHVLTICLSGIITGGQYVVSFDYNPAGVAATLYTAKIQYAIHHIGTPLFGALIATTIFCLLSAVLYFKGDRRTSILLFLAMVFFLIGALITRFGNIPLLDIMDTWSAQSPPADWLDIAGRWYAFHSVRLGVDVVGFLLAITSSFTARREN